MIRLDEGGHVIVVFNGLPVIFNNFESEFF